MGERTGWRDEALAKQMNLWDIDGSMVPGGNDMPMSLRHREWGQGLYAVDNDLVLTESNGDGPVAVIEYKFCAAQPIRFEDNFQVRQVAKQADRMNVPAFLIVYQRSPLWVFTVWPLNAEANLILGAEWKTVSERQLVRWMYRIRGYAITERLQTHIEQFTDEIEPMDERLRNWRMLAPPSAA